MESSSKFRERSRFLSSLAILVALAVGSAPASQAESNPDSNRDEQEIRLLVASYAKSIDAADAKLASQIWLNSPEVSFIHPLGHEHRRRGHHRVGRGAGSSGRDDQGRRAGRGDRARLIHLTLRMRSA